MTNSQEKRRFKRFNVLAALEMKRCNRSSDSKKRLSIKLLDLSAEGFGFLTSDNLHTMEKAYVTLPLLDKGTMPCVAEVVHVNKRGADYRAGARII